MIIKEYKGKKCLDHFMQVIYTKYYEKLGRGFTEIEFEKEVSEFLHKDMSEFFKKYIYGTEIPDFNAIFEQVGLGVEYLGNSQVSFGASLSQSGGKLMVSRIRSNSAAENGGLSVKDEIVGCNGYRVSQKDLEKVINSLSSGETMKLLISRDDVLYEIVIKLENYESPKYEFVERIKGTNGDLLDYWLRRTN